jgi:hypothetical protein
VEEAVASLASMVVVESVADGTLLLLDPDTDEDADSGAGLEISQSFVLMLVTLSCPLLMTSACLSSCLVSLVSKLIVIQEGGMMYGVSVGRKVVMQ